MRRLWERSPVAWRVGMIVAVLAQFCSIDSIASWSVNGQVVECSYLDYGKVIFGVLALGLAVGGWVKHRSQRPKLPQAAAIIIPVVIAMLGVVLLLRGFGLLLNPCDDLISGALALWS